MGEPLIQALDEQPIDAVIWEKAALIAGLAVSIFFYHFTCLFVRREGGKWPSTLLHVAAVAMAELAASGLVGGISSKNGTATRRGRPPCSRPTSSWSTP